MNSVILWTATALPRLLVFMAISVSLWLILQPVRLWVTRPRQPLVAFLFVFLAINLGDWFFFDRTAVLWVGIAGALLLANAWPAEDLNGAYKVPHLYRALDIGLLLGVGVVEILLPRVLWVRLRRKFDRHYQLRNSKGTEDQLYFGPGILVAALICTIHVPNGALISLGHKLLLSHRADLIYGGNYSFSSQDDVSGLILDTENERLLLCGNGLSSIGLLALNVEPPRYFQSNIPTGKNQFCDLDPHRNEIAVFNQSTKQLILADGRSLQVNRRLTVENMPPEGEVFLGFDKTSGSIVIASEDSTSSDTVRSIKVLNSRDLSLRFELDIDPGYITVHPIRPILYVNYFWRDSGVHAFSLIDGSQIAKVSGAERTDRMVVDTARNQLLVTSPSKGLILVFDAETLAPFEPIKTVLGSRGLAIDHSRDLLIVSSLLTNRIDILDLKSRRSLRREWLGPWLRDVAIDEKNGTAYVSSRYGVYRVDFAGLAVPETDDPGPGNIAYSGQNTNMAGIDTATTSTSSGSPIRQ